MTCSSKLLTLKRESLEPLIGSWLVRSMDGQDLQVASEVGQSCGAESLNSWDLALIPGSWSQN